MTIPIFRYKIAALTPAEKEEMVQVVRNHAKFEQSTLGEMTEAMKEAMRHNAERLRLYSAKKLNDSATIPAWARDPAGAPAAAESYVHRGRSGTTGGWTGNRSYTNSVDYAARARKNRNINRAILGGIVMTNIGLRYMAYKQNKKPKDTERSDKGKTHKKNYSYTSPKMKKAASY